MRWSILPGAATTLAVLLLLGGFSGAPAGRAGEQGWERVLDLGTTGNPPLLFNLVRVDGLLYAVGRDGDGSALLFVSRDGRNWNREPVLLPEGMDWADLHAVATDGRTTVAVGSAGANSAAAWLRNDDGSWMPARLDDPQPKFAVMLDVLASGAGFIAVGTANQGFDTDELAAIWTSHDGSSWARLPIAPHVGGLSDLIVDDGRLIAVGMADSRASIWSSDDGLAWQAAGPFGPTGTGFASIVRAGRELLAVGPYLHPWVSRDGVHWTEMTRGPQLERVVWTGSALVGYMNFLRPGDEGGGLALWLSPNGRRWQRLPVPDPAIQDFTGLVSFDDGLVVTGDIGGRGGIWFRTSLPPTATSARQPGLSATFTRVPLVAVAFLIGILLIWRRMTRQATHPGGAGGRSSPAAKRSSQPRP